MRPFSALRYDPAVAGPLDEVVAPPYDVIDADARRDYLARSPYNVVHLTLPDTPEQAGEALAAWRGEGALASAPESYWWVAQDYRGPDGVAAHARGLRCGRRGGAVRGAGRCCRTSARMPGRRRGG